MMHLQTAVQAVESGATVRPTHLAVTRKARNRVPRHRGILQALANFPLQLMACLLRARLRRALAAQTATAERNVVQSSSHCITQSTAAPGSSHSVSARRQWSRGAGSHRTGVMPTSSGYSLAA